VSPLLPFPRQTWSSLSQDLYIPLLVQSLSAWRSGSLAWKAWAFRSMAVTIYPICLSLTSISAKALATPDPTNGGNDMNKSVSLFLPASQRRHLHRSLSSLSPSLCLFSLRSLSPCDPRSDPLTFVDQASWRLRRINRENRSGWNTVAGSMTGAVMTETRRERKTRGLMRTGNGGMHSVMRFAKE
jgi:hypothetical protein